jgi:DNA-binding GntR family transcriptional regulator
MVPPEMRSVSSDAAYDYIRKRILSGEYAPGQPLLTEVLSSQVKVSRTPVRDALRQLEADGLVVIRAHLGASVKAMDLREYREICELRLALESHAAGLAALHRTTSDVQELRFVLESMRELTEQLRTAEREQPLATQLGGEDVRFHVAIISAAKNEAMKREILRLHLISRVMAGPGRAERRPAPADKAARFAPYRHLLARHEKIFAAIENSDGPAARAAMEAHIQDVIDQSLQHLARSESSFIAKKLTEEELSYTV